MPELDPKTALFFDSHLEALPLYAEFLCGVRRICPAVQEKVCKTQISLSCGRVFACASFLRVLPKAKLPPASFVLTLGLPAPLLSPRVAARTEAYPGRWTHHIVLSRREDLDAELFSWVCQALDFAQKKIKASRSVSKIPLAPFLHLGYNRRGNTEARCKPMQDERDIVVFTDDEGNDFELEVMDYFFYNGQEYAVLSDAEDAECGCEECAHDEETCDDEACEGCADQEVYIMKIVQMDDDMEEFVPIEDDSLMEKLIAIVQRRFDGEEVGDDPDEEI